MTHSDDDGLIIPPKNRTYAGSDRTDPQTFGGTDRGGEKIAAELKAKGVRVKIDNDDQNRPGFKFAEYEMIGIPVRLGLGQRDIAAGVVEVARRDTKEKSSVALDTIADHVANLLDEIQSNLFNRAKAYRDEHITKVDTWRNW